MYHRGHWGLEQRLPTSPRPRHVWEDERTSRKKT